MNVNDIEVRPKNQHHYDGNMPPTHTPNRFNPSMELTNESCQFRGRQATELNSRVFVHIFYKIANAHGRDSIWIRI